MRRQTSWECLHSYVQKVVEALSGVNRALMIFATAEAERLRHRRLWCLERELFIKHCLSSKGIVANDCDLAEDFTEAHIGFLRHLSETVEVHGSRQAFFFQQGGLDGKML